MIGGWREDFNEGPYDYLAVRDGWEIFQSRSGEPFRVTAPDGSRTEHDREREAKAHAYANGCSKP